MRACANLQWGLFSKEIHDWLNTLLCKGLRDSNVAVLVGQRQQMSGFAILTAGSLAGQRFRIMGVAIVLRGDRGLERV